MRNWYSGTRAHSYDRLWRTFTERSLSAALAMLDWQALDSVPERFSRAPCALDVGCGTGILLRHLLEHVPGLHVCGVDASADMLAQARLTLSTWPDVELLQVKVGAGATADLPYTAGPLM